MRTGDRTIELTFDQALRETVSAMVYYEYDDLLRIDEARTVKIVSDIGQRAKPTSEQNRPPLHSYINLYTSNFQLGFISA